MKKLKIVFMLLMLSISGIYGRDFPSVNDRSIVHDEFDKPYIQTEEWKRHKMFKALGWASLLGGAGCICSAFAMEDQGKAMKILIGGGGGLCLASFPLFGLARSNKLKAYRLSLQGCHLASPMPTGGMGGRAALSILCYF